MRARIIDQQVKLYSSPEPDAISLATLAAGTEIEFGGVRKIKGKQWVEVVMPTGQKGYIPGETHIFHFRLASLLQKSVDVYTQPTQHSLVRTSLKRNTKIYLTEVVKGEDQDWVRVREMEGGEGYISGRTRIRIIPEKTKALAKKNMLSGALWVIAGGMILGLGSSSAGGGTSIFAWGLTIYGAFLLISGIYQYFTAAS